MQHSDRGSHDLALRYTDRLAGAGVQPSPGSVGGLCDTALAKTINGLFKAEVIHQRSPWRSMEAVEFATLDWVDWFNNRCLREPIGTIPLPRQKRAITRKPKRKPWPRSPVQMAREKPGTIHTASVVTGCAERLRD